MDYQRVEALFYAALEKPTDDRQQYVSRLSSNEPELAHAVLRLLSCHDKNVEDGFVIESLLPCTVLESDESAPWDEDLSSETIDRYRLLEKIGEGGMGVVYMAEQVLGVKRRVAIKVVKPGLDGRQVVARFEIERQALAMFEHHAIAKVFDSGSTNDGRPYFVMELVRGLSITDYAKQHSLGLTDKLGLFVTVCDAVHHAHQKGIIHRDLKPANIMVTRVDGVPQVKIIDFGIAKALDERLTDATCYTRYATIIGTPQYMSPEQADAKGVDIDTRSDVYALGVVLYELLTGDTPISAGEFSGLNPLQQLETIRQADDVTPPSLMISNPPQRKANQDLKRKRPIWANVRELDSIVLTALSRNRNERYQSARDFAQDIRRYLDGEPVEAAAPSRFYKLKKMLQRHRRTVISIAIVFVTLVASLFVCIAYAIDAWQANQSKDQTLTELKKVNSDLQRNNRKLKAAQETIRANSTARIKTFAFEKSLQSFQQVVWNRVSHLFPKYIMSGDADIDGATGLKQYMQVFPAEINYVEHLFDLRYRNLLGDEIQVLNQVAKEMTPTGHKKSRLIKSEPPDVANEVFVEVAKVRHQFFEILCTNYKSMFGPDDPRICEALNLLACALIEMEMWQRAHEVANESFRVADNQRDRATASRLLELIDSYPGEKNVAAGQTESK